VDLVSIISNLDCFWDLFKSYASYKKDWEKINEKTVVPKSVPGSKNDTTGEEK
jgi:hypothetical protein